MGIRDKAVSAAPLPMLSLNATNTHFMKLLITLLLVFALSGASAQQKNLSSVRLGVSTSQTALPFGALSALFYRDFHPGIEVAYRQPHHGNDRRNWTHEPVLSYMFHRWVHHNVALGFNEYYSHRIGNGLAATARLGVGYQLSIPAVDVYTFSDGIKRKRFAGRSQFVANLAAGIQKDLSRRCVLLLLYQQQVQTPFVKSYVSLLPYNSAILSITYTLHSKTERHETH